ncbi:MAG: transposase [Chloroflexota bacterium]|nr:transposase [Chloroflexota bacterium]
MDDSYFIASKPSKRVRSSEGKDKVVVAVESKGDKAGFASMCHVEKMSSEKIKQVAELHLDQWCIVRTDGWHAYTVLDTDNTSHEPIVLGSGKNVCKA